MRKIAVLFLTVILLASSYAAADEILLKNGNVVTGKIVAEDEKSVTIRVYITPPGTSESEAKFIEMKFDKSRIKRVTRDATIFKPTERTAAEEKDKEAERAAPVGPVDAVDTSETKDGKGGTEEDDSKAEEVKTEESVPKKDKNGDELDPSVKLQVNAILKSFDIDTNRKSRERNEQRLIALGRKISHILIEELNKGGRDLKRVSLMKVLHATNEKRAVQALIGQLTGGRKNRTRMQIAWQALRAITGKDIYFDNDDAVREQKIQIAKWQEWFDSVREEYPEQIGFEDKKPATKKESAESVKEEGPKNTVE